ncbi:hypothetical protein C8F04DRAFT_1160513 [Mycena alexandri]|uniref:Uncharacterized protein n=1 Tax=Mycena alexandri TaxID=1745969 RepID=A0AAD6RWH2_9AGAR|nr:hypothetical protein C8F04DRAFT_1160513 [Mycena alexandri]
MDWRVSIVCSPLPFLIARAFTCLAYIRAAALPPPPRLSSDIRCRQPHSSTRAFGHFPCAVLSSVSSHKVYYERDCMLYRLHCGQGSGPPHTCILSLTLQYIPRLPPSLFRGENNSCPKY